MTTKLEREIIRRVAEARKDAHLTHKELGQALSLSETGYGHYERGRQALTVEQLFILSRVLSHSVEHFLGLENGLAEDEDALLATYRSIHSPEIRELVRDVAKDQARLDARLTARFGEPE